VGLVCALSHMGLGCGDAESDVGPSEAVPSFSTPGATGQGPAAGNSGSSPAAGAGTGGTSSGGTSSGGTAAVPAVTNPEGNVDVPLQPGSSDPSAAGTGSGDPPGGSVVPAPPPALEDVLVFSRTMVFRHPSIGPGIEAIRRLGTENGFAVEATEDPSIFSDAGLAPFDVVVFLSTTGDVLDETQQAAFERFIRAGGGWVGVHAAADTEYDWAWYGQLLGGGAFFKSHPVGTPLAQLDVEQAAHDATSHLAARFAMTDEWYNFRANPRPAVNVLLRLDESSYAPGPDAMGSDHPIAWYHEFDGGRAWYTGIGHRPELYAAGGDPAFLEHLLGGIRWAAGVAP
jgi:type 1 glutamine amidotransferase